MLIGGVIHDQIKDYLHVPCMDLIDQLLADLHIAIFRSNALIIADIVAEIALRTFEEWRDPNGLKPQFPDVVQFLDDAVQVTQSIAICITVRPRVDLVNRCRSPPVIGV